jgi:tetratricopeptide (TPR) repeat protein
VAVRFRLVSSSQWPGKAALALALAVVLPLTTRPSAAQEAARPAEAAPEARDAEARRHFDRSLELYRAGHYAEALEQLERAAELDPNGKDLFFNLSLVHEKLGQLSQAIAALERFRELEPDERERERARVTIERLKGAEAAARARRTEPVCPAAAAAPAPPPGRPTAVLLGTASLAVVSLIVGAVFGAKALSDDIGQTGTSASLSLGQLRERGRRAEREALVADVAFAVSAASAGTFAGVWLLSPGEPHQRAAGITLRSYF